MNVTPFLLILFLVCTCHALGILATMKGKDQAETHRDLLCPDPTDIEPCECTNIGGLNMDCSKVQDEAQLRKVFSADFPSTEFSDFIMRHNNGVKVLEDGVFGNVSFQSLDIVDSVLETVENDALTSSLSTLLFITIDRCQLNEFPFEKLAEFTSLDFLISYYNKISTLPPLSSSSLRSLSFTHNIIGHLSSDVFKLLSTVKAIYLNKNQLTEISKETFTGLPNLTYVDLSYNNISHLQSLTFELVSSPSSWATLDLRNNNIDSVEVDTFKGIQEPAYIIMKNNALTRLEEEAWRPVLEKGIYVELEGNPLACGCDVAWLVRDPQLLTTVTDARCADGTMLTDLNPADFDICG